MTQPFYFWGYVVSTSSGIETDSPDPQSTRTRGFYLENAGKHLASRRHSQNEFTFGPTSVCWDWAEYLT